MPRSLGFSLLSITALIKAMLLWRCQNVQRWYVIPPEPKPRPIVEIQDEIHKPLPKRKVKLEFPISQYTPQADVLFILDVSESMRPHLSKLQKASSDLVQGLSSFNVLDYRIGVTFTWDSKRGVNYSQYLWTNEPGALRRVKVNALKSVTQAMPNQISVLNQLLEPIIVPLRQGGPEFEEFFSPLVGSLVLAQDSSRENPNRLFFRKNAHFAAIFVTDADDSSLITPLETYGMLLKFKPAEKILLYGLLVKADDPPEFKDFGLRPSHLPECAQNPQNEVCQKGLGPDRITELILLANAHTGSPEQIRQSKIFHLFEPNYQKIINRIGEDLVRHVSQWELDFPYSVSLGEDGRPELTVSFVSRASQQALAYRLNPSLGKLVVQLPVNQLSPNSKIVVEFLTYEVPSNYPAGR